MKRSGAMEEGSRSNRLAPLGEEMADLAKDGGTG
jgi:hypothetical protein